MRIIIFSSSGTYSGGIRQAMYLAQGFAQAGHEVTFFVPPVEEKGIIELAPNRPDTPDTPGTPDTPDKYVINWKILPENHYQWRQAIEKELPEPGVPCVIQAVHNKANKKLAWWGLFWRRRGIACFGYRGVSYRPNNPLPYLSWGMDCYIANSRACAKILRRVGLAERRSAVVYNGIPADRLKPVRSAQEVREETGLKEGMLLFGSVANNRYTKGVRYTIEGFARATDQGLDARLLIIGIKPAIWGKMAEETGVLERCLFFDHKEHVADYLQILDVFVMASVAGDSLPNSLGEALNFGIPAIGTTVGGIPELVLDGKNGLVIPPRDAEAMAHAMLTLAGSEELRKQMGRVSTEHARQFTIENKVQNTLKVYTKYLKKRGLVV